jgi:ketosteroid isomerase-like protein
MIPYADLRRGRDGVTGCFGAFAKALEVARFEPQRFFATDDMVVVLGRYTKRDVN